MGASLCQDELLLPPREPEVAGPTLLGRSRWSCPAADLSAFGKGLPTIVEDLEEEWAAGVDGEVTMASLRDATLLQSPSTSTTIPLLPSRPAVPLLPTFPESTRSIPTVPSLPRGKVVGARDLVAIAHAHENEAGVAEGARLDGDEVQLESLHIKTPTEARGRVEPHTTCESGIQGEIVDSVGVAPGAAHMEPPRIASATQVVRARDLVAIAHAYENEAGVAEGARLDGNEEQLESLHIQTPTEARGRVEAHTTRESGIEAEIADSAGVGPGAAHIESPRIALATDVGAHLGGSQNLSRPDSCDTPASDLTTKSHGTLIAPFVVDWKQGTSLQRARAWF